MLLRSGGAIVCALLALILATACGAASTPDATGHRSLVLGHSVDGRRIAAIETGDFDAPHRALIVGCIHGNEPAGIAVARWLAARRPPRELDLWLLPDLNPDGVAAHSRGNAHGVDLNRNFPWRWQPLGGVYYSGRHALSEPESRIAYRLIRRIGPNVSVWFHQHLGLVDKSGGSGAAERRFSTVSGLRLRRLAREPGSVVTWENHRALSKAFVVELPRGALATASVRRFGRAVLAASSGAGD